MVHETECSKHIYKLHWDAFNKLALGVFIVALFSLFIQRQAVNTAPSARTPGTWILLDNNEVLEKTKWENTKARKWTPKNDKKLLLLNII